MHKTLVKARQSFAIIRLSYLRSISRSLSANLQSEKDDAEFCASHIDLDADSSWEAGVLRHERDLDRLRKQGVTEEDLPGFDREEKVENLPHVTFYNKKNFEIQETLLDESSKMMLGAVQDEGKVDINYKNSNFDPDFYREDVQEIIKRLHYRCQMEQVYKPNVTDRKTMPLIQYLNDRELKEEIQKMEQKLTDKLKMPLVLTEREPCSRVLADDHILDGYEDSNVSFVDISEDLNERERFIVIREPNGKLRAADWDERDRLLQIYYPKPGRTIIPPSLFNKDTIENIFNQKLHENALDQCVLQFEPDSKEYIETFNAVYKNIDEQKLYYLLENTRYYGGLVYFLVKNFSIDFLILRMINNKQIESAADCISLLTLLHPDCKTKSSLEQINPEDEFSIIEAYVKDDSKEQNALLLALENLSTNDEGSQKLESEV